MNSILVPPGHEFHLDDSRQRDYHVFPSQSRAFSDIRSGCHVSGANDFAWPNQMHSVPWVRVAAVNKHADAHRFEVLHIHSAGGRAGAAQMSTPQEEIHILRRANRRWVDRSDPNRNRLPAD